MRVMEMNKGWLKIRSLDCSAVDLGKLKPRCHFEFKFHRLTHSTALYNSLVFSPLHVTLDKKHLLNVQM